MSEPRRKFDRDFKREAVKLATRGDPKSRATWESARTFCRAGNGIQTDDPAFAFPRKGNCYDNAISESFFGTLKTELVYLSRFRTRAEAREAIFSYIKVFYNRQRRHSTLGYHSPSEFERQYYSKCV
jgi:transposase InsO family protein